MQLLRKFKVTDKSGVMFQSVFGSYADRCRANPIHTFATEIRLFYSLSNRGTFSASQLSEINKGLNEQAEAFAGGRWKSCTQ